MACYQSLTSANSVEYSTSPLKHEKGPIRTAKVKCELRNAGEVIVKMNHYPYIEGEYSLGTFMTTQTRRPSVTPWINIQCCLGKHEQGTLRSTSNHMI